MLWCIHLLESRRKDSACQLESTICCKSCCWFPGIRVSAYSTQIPVFCACSSAGDRNQPKAIIIQITSALASSMSEGMTCENLQGMGEKLHKQAPEIPLLPNQESTMVHAYIFTYMHIYILSHIYIQYIRTIITREHLHAYIQSYMITYKVTRIHKW